jgi:hypothetical protein
MRLIQTTSTSFPTVKREGAMRTITTALALVGLLAAHTEAETIRVPDGVATIQAALDSCSAGDTVLVGPGSYTENLLWPNTQSLCLMSEKGSDSTVIDGNRSGTVILILTGVDTTTIIRGFTIQDGRGEAGAGIRCKGGASPTITENLITNNVAYGPGGGGISCDNGSSPIISYNSITYNSASTSGGGGIVLDTLAAPRIIGNTIAHNSCALGGGGILGFNFSRASIFDNLISDNSAGSGGGGMALQATVSSVVGNTVTRNVSTSGGGIHTGHYDSTVFVRNTIIENNATVRGGGIRTKAQCSNVIDSCIIAYNTGDGVYSDDRALPLLRYSDIYGNTGFGVRNDCPHVVVSAKHNWWGHSSGPGGAGPGSGDEVSERVDYTPWKLTTGVVKFISEGQPIRYALSQNYPNPFNPATRIRFSLPHAGLVTLKVYSVLGEEVAALIEEPHEAGTYEVTWDAKGLSSGVYFYRLRAGDFVQTRRAILTR